MGQSSLRRPSVQLLGRFFLHVWTHELVHCCAQPGQRLIKIPLWSYCPRHPSSKRTVRQQISVTLNWLEHQSTAASARFHEIIYSSRVTLLFFFSSSLFKNVQRGHTRCQRPTLKLTGSACDDRVGTVRKE
ncbi:hypothetical protein D9C73_013794 [Collichthys lucidus]|uniref:Uncharacterized protein n=1 Tax=Collichthys lucidus TaxID=240159 RepID=A0A4U5V172_COLLU|nr:hypothetical protein D9C73_013794 [Collichthys lucidus]